MAQGTVYRRSGIAKNLTLSHEAVAVLHQRAPSFGTQGWLVSTLLLAEQARREERARLKAQALEAEVERALG